MGLLDLFKQYPGKPAATEAPVSAPTTRTEPAVLPLAAAADLAQQLVRIANESLQIANSSKDLATRRSRMELARQKLSELKVLASQHPQITLISLAGFEHSIEEVERETDLLRGGASSAERAADDFITGQRSSVSGWEVDPVLSQLHSAAVPEGVFWHDHIKTLRNEPEARLQVARDFLPLPAAFREAAVALRALIRSKKRQREAYEDLLEGLYRLAAQESLFYAVQCIPDLGPSINVAAELPRQLWLAEMEYPYQEIGYHHLELLTTTDKKWIIEAWGEPKQHTTAQAFHEREWGAAVERTRQRAKRRREDFLRMLHDLHP